MRARSPPGEHALACIQKYGSAMSRSLEEKATQVASLSRWGADRCVLLEALPPPPGCAGPKCCMGLAKGAPGLEELGQAGTPEPSLFLVQPMRPSWQTGVALSKVSEKKSQSTKLAELPNLFSVSSSGVGKLPNMVDLLQLFPDSRRPGAHFSTMSWGN
ncbi:unnamed protein product [Effrenium voratum]|nr:unnamed protein product [Effrenium voratum]